MKRIRQLILLLSILIAFIDSLNAQAAKDIVKRSEDIMRGNTSQAEMSIITQRSQWKRELRLKSWTKGNDYVIILIQSPAKEKGIAFLKRKKEIWNWVPSLNRSIKLPPSMMSQSWMGTDFKNDDLVKESSILNDYQHKLIGDCNILNKECYKIELIPLPESSVVWGKIILCIGKSNFLLLQAEYYNEDNKLINTMRANKTGNLGGRQLVTEYELIPNDKPENKTLMIYNKIKFDAEIKDDFFSIPNLSRLK